MIGVAKSKANLTQANTVAHMVEELAVLFGECTPIEKSVGEGLMNSLLASEDKSLKGFSVFPLEYPRNFNSFLLPSKEASKLKHPRRLYL
jgi:hypothetical protein